MNGFSTEGLIFFTVGPARSRANGHSVSHQPALNTALHLSLPEPFEDVAQMVGRLQNCRPASSGLCRRIHFKGRVWTLWDYLFQQAGNQASPRRPSTLRFGKCSESRWLQKGWQRISFKTSARFSASPEVQEQPYVLYALRY